MPQAPLRMTDELLRAIEQLEIRARRRVTALLAGNYRSAFRGSGMQFKEFRHYEEGDDIRHMSWQVTARTGRATIKTYEEERELDVILVVDVSGSSLFGNGNKRKIDMYSELVAVLGLATVKSGDNLGLHLFNDKPGLYLPARRSREQVHSAIAHVLAQPLRGTKSDLRPVFNFLETVLKHRSIIIVLSDFWMPSFRNEAIRLAKHHELVLLHCYDDAERGLSMKGILEVWDPEQLTFCVIDGNSKQVQRVLSEHHMKLTNELESIVRSSRSDYLTLSLEDDYLERLVHFFKHRGPSRL